jgi:hypothetical protein
MFAFDKAVVTMLAWTGVAVSPAEQAGAGVARKPAPPPVERAAAPVEALRVEWATGSGGGAIVLVTGANKLDVGGPRPPRLRAPGAPRVPPMLD